MKGVNLECKQSLTIFFLIFLDSKIRQNERSFALDIFHDFFR